MNYQPPNTSSPYPPQIPSSPQPLPPQTFIPTPPPPPIFTPNPPSHPPIKLILIIVSTLILLGGSGFIGLSLADAYRAIPVSFPLTHTAGLAMIMNLPFLPKTPEQIVVATIAAHQDIKSGAYNISLATASKSFAGILGTQNFDVVLDGKVDWHDEENPQATLHMNVAGQLDAESVTVNKAAYFKINEVPQGLLGLISGSTGINLSDVSGLLKIWVQLETKELETEARDILEQSNSDEESNPFTDPLYQQTFMSIYQETILPNLSLLTEVKESIPVYHLSLALPGKTLDTLFQKIAENDKNGKMKYMIDTDQMVLSDVIKDLQIELYINEKDYLINTLSVIAKIDNAKLLDKADTVNPQSNSILNREIYTVATSLKLSDLGEPMAITAPPQSITMDEYIAQITKLFTIATASPSANLR